MLRAVAKPSISRSVGKPSDNCTTCKQFATGRQHDVRHSAAGGQSGDEDLIRINTVRLNDVADHLTD